MRLRRRRDLGTFDVPPPIPCACPPSGELVPTPDGEGFVHLWPCPFAPAHPVTVVRAAVRTDGDIELGDIPAGFRGGILVKVDGNARLTPADMARITDRIRVKLAADEPELCPMAPYVEAIDRNKQEIAAAFGVDRAALGPDADAPPLCPGCGFRHPGSHPAKDTRPASSHLDDVPPDVVARAREWIADREAAKQKRPATTVETAVQLAVRLDREANELSSAYRWALQRADQAWRAIGGRP